MPPDAAPVIAPTAPVIAPAAPAAAPPPAPAPPAGPKPNGKPARGHRPSDDARNAAVAALVAEHTELAATEAPAADPAAPVEGAPAATDPKQTAILAARADAERRAAEFRAKRDALAVDHAARQKAKAERDDIERQRAEVARDADLLRLAKSDPLAFLAKQGMTADQLVERGLQAGDKSSRVERELAELRAKIEADAQAQATARQRAAENAARAQVETYERGFVAMVTTSPDLFPTLSEAVDVFGADAVRAEATKIARQVHAETGETPSHDEILHYLESEVSKRKASRAGSAGRVGTASPGVSGATKAAPVDTLTSAQTPNTPAASRALTPAERRAAAAEQIRRMRNE